MSNISELHIESGQTLFKTEFAEMQLQLAHKQNAVRISNNYPTEDSHFKNIDALKEDRDAEAKKYIKELDMLKSQVLIKYPHLKK